MHFHKFPVMEANVLVGLQGQGTGRASLKLQRGVTVGSGPLWSMWMEESSCRTLHRVVHVNERLTVVTKSHCLPHQILRIPLGTFFAFKFVFCCDK